MIRPRKAVEGEAPTVRLVQNWLEELDRLVDRAD